MSIPLVAQFYHELVFTIIISVLGVVAMWPIKKVTKAYTDLTGRLDVMSKELEVQRTNHLSHIEASNDKQVEILEKVSDTLQAMHTDQRILLDRIGR